MKRNMVNKAPDIQCQWCKQMISSYNLTNHIKFRHGDLGSVEKYVLEFGEFRKNKTPTKGIRKIGTIICELCGKEYSAVGMHTHLRDRHDGLTPDKYVELGYTEYRSKQIDYKKRSELNEIQCLICNRDNFASHRQFADHVRIDHDSNMEEYVKEYIFKGIQQVCKCGCGQPVKIGVRPPYEISYVSGHNPNGMIGRSHEKSSKEKMRIKAIERGNAGQLKSNSKPELKFVRFLQENNISFQTQVITEYGCIDFYLPDLDIYVEIDGVYWHPLKPESLNLQLLSSCISQKKREFMPNLYRIREDAIDELRNIDDIFKFNAQYDLSISYRQKIVDKEYFQNIDDNEKKKCVPVLQKFLLEFQPEFPKIETKEILEKVVSKIRTYDFSTIKTGLGFRNNCSNVGVEYLKSRFRSYWKSSYKGQKPPIEIWKDPEMMKKIIEYRIGLNDSGEIFDFTLHQMVRGISAIRHCISFFKPILAAGIYEEFLGNIISPVVLDPCAGFGGRMLGFKSLYPDGVYIGVEPNPETFSELMELASNLSNIQLFPCKIEDVDISLLGNIDLTFTSIPYYDLEIYSNPVEYPNCDEWTSTFLGKIKSLPNLLLNIPESLRSKFPECLEEYKIWSNTSHFNKKETQKFEYLLKF